MDIHPLTDDRRPDLQRLFGDRGEAGGCSCMFWRIKRSEFDHNGKAGNRAALERLTAGGTVPGVLGYRDGVPVGWCSIGPREQFGALERSPKFRRLDDAPVWSVVCFFVAREHRHEHGAREHGARGHDGPGRDGREHVIGPLLDAAVAYAWKQGAEIVEGYPSTDSGHYMGSPGVFERAGFREAQRLDDKRSVYRLHAPG